MRKIQKMCAALLAGVMTVGTFAPSVFADEAAKELTDGLEMDDGSLLRGIIP